MIQKQWFFLLSIVALVLLPLPTQASQNAQQIPAPQSIRYEPGDCQFDLPIGAIEGSDIECGFLIVPERHLNPDGPTIKLAVAIINSTSANPLPDPFVMAQGGPGGSTIQFAQLMINSPLRTNRDIILFDQRGTLNSEPNLLCPEQIALVEEIIEEDISTEEGYQLSQEAMIACHDRLVAEGVNLAAYNSLENAADVEALRVALGYDQINFYGISYGTLLALHVMRDYPQGLRTVILDAVVPPQRNFVTEVPQTQDRAFTQLFESCANDPDCQGDYPNLEERFFNLVAELNETPARVPMTDPETGNTYNAVVNGDAVVDLTFQFLYQTDFIPILPKMIAEMEDGNFSIPGNILPVVIFDRTFSLGMYQSVICAEDADFRPSDVRTEGVRPELIANSDLETQVFLDTCQAWNVPDLGPAVDQPVNSNIPTLLFSGNFDPITPPRFGEEVARGLSNGYHFVFPTNGHGAVVPGSQCSNQLVQNFLANPTTPPNGDCVENLPVSPDFIAASSLTVPIFGAIATSPSWRHLAQFTILIMGLLGLLSAWIIWPITIIIHWIQHKRLPNPPLGARLLRPVVLAAGFFGLVFIGGLIGAAFYLIASGDLSMLFVGLPSVATPLFFMPPLFLILLVVMVIGTILAWVSNYWSIWGRLYYTILTICAIGYVVILLQWGLIGVLL